MDDMTEIKQIQETLLALLPYWNYRIEKPFKQLLDSGISLEMYYCIETLRWFDGTLTMSELAHWIQMPKQQMTKIVNRLVEYEFVERIYDPADRRLIKIKITDKALTYIDHFLEQDAGCFRQLLGQMSREERGDFKKAIETMMRILTKLPSSGESGLSAQNRLYMQQNNEERQTGD